MVNGIKEGKESKGEIRSQMKELSPKRDVHNNRAPMRSGMPHPMGTKSAKKAKKEGKSDVSNTTLSEIATLINLQLNVGI